MRPRVAVIGGGIAGLAVSALLADGTRDVRLLEARDELGGRAGSWERNGFRFDTGPSWYLMPEVFEHFFRLLGTSVERELDLADLSPAYRVYAEGSPAPIDVPSGRDAAMALFEGREVGAGARLGEYLDSAASAYRLATDRFLYDGYESAAGLLDSALVPEIPRLAGLLTRSLETHIARRFRDRVLRQILGYPAVFLGGSPARIPALYHLMSHLDLGDGVRYPRGGFTELIRAIERIARARGVAIETGSEVAKIETAGARATGVLLADGRRIGADLVVSTADLHETEMRLLPPALRTYPAAWWEKRSPSPGALLLLLGVRGRLPQLAHHTLLFTHDWRTDFADIFDHGRIPEPASIYVCRPSATDATVAPTGHENLFVLVPVPADPALGRGGVDGGGDAGIEQAADRVIAQLSAWCGIPDLRDRIVVRRTIAPGDFATDLRSWRGNALGLAHTLGQSAFLRPRNVSSRVANLYYAGASVLPGVGLPLCLISAELVAKRIAGVRGAGRLPEPVSTEV